MKIVSVTLVLDVFNEVSSIFSTFSRPFRTKFRTGDVHKKNFGLQGVFVKIGAVKSCTPGRRRMFVFL